MTSYAEVPYASVALPQTQPDRMAVAAVLRGLPPPHPARCTVLEIGCADAGNLIALAASAPESRFVGIDVDGRAIARARSRIAAWGIGNVEVVEADLATFEGGEGGFDYVVAHGVYSWVSEPLRRTLLDTVRRHLAPGGIGYVSYNTYPGSHLRSMVGEAVRRLVGDVAPEELAAEARTWLDLLQRSGFDGAHASVLQQVAAEAAAKPDQLLVHDDLALTAEPFYLSDFVARASDAGLAFLGDAELTPSLPPSGDAELVGRLRAMAEVDRQQTMDVLANRSFRQTLLVHADHGTALTAVVPERLEPLFLATTVQHLSDDRLRLRNGITISTGDVPLRHALGLAGAAWPACVPVADLDCDRAALLRLAEARGVELWYEPVPAVRPGDLPRVRDVVRHQAGEGVPLTTLRHETVRADDPIVRVAVQRFDGEHTRAEIADELAGHPRVSPGSAVRADLDALIDRFADASLFLG